MRDEFDFLPPEKAARARELCEEQIYLGAKIVEDEDKRYKWETGLKGSQFDESTKKIMIWLIGERIRHHENGYADCLQELVELVD